MASFSYNKVVLVGRLTRDPELRHTNTGRAVAGLGLATSRAWRTDQGELKEETTFVDIEAWGKQAETIARYLRKGRPVLVEGRLQTDQWEDRNTGQKRSRLKVVLDNFSFLDSRPQQEGHGAPPASPPIASAPPAPQPSAAPPPASPPPQQGGPDQDEDIPF